MDLIRRLGNRDGAAHAANGEMPALEDDPELAEGDGQLIGQEMVPFDSSLSRTLTVKGNESGKGVGSSEARSDPVQPGQEVSNEGLKTPNRDGKGSRATRVDIYTPMKGSGQGREIPGSAVTPHQEGHENGLIGDEENVFWSSQRHPGDPQLPMVQPRMDLGSRSLISSSFSAFSSCRCKLPGSTKRQDLLVTLSHMFLGLNRWSWRK